MIIWFNDKGFRCGGMVRQSSDGRILTLVTENLNKSVSEIAEMLEGETEIRLCNDSNILESVYKSDGLAAIAMELSGGSRVVTATLYARRIGEDEADRLHRQIMTLADRLAGQAETLSGQGAKLAQQEETIGALREGMNGAAAAADAVRAILQAMEEGIEDA